MEKNKKFAFFKKKSTEFHDFHSNFSNHFYCENHKLDFLFFYFFINNFREKNDETSKDEKKKNILKRKYSCLETNLYLSFSFNINFT